MSIPPNDDDLLHSRFKPRGRSPQRSPAVTTTNEAGEEAIQEFLAVEMKSHFSSLSDQRLFAKVVVADGLES